MPRSRSINCSADSNNCNIKVAIRSRPLDALEAPKWKIDSNSIIQAFDGEEYGERISFDQIFDQQATNAEIYFGIVQDFIHSALNGLNSTIFAYGQTSSGKTYTMMGDEREKGLMQLSVEDIFAYIAESTNCKFLLRVSYIEIYQEKMFDLLSPKEKVQLRMQPDGNFQLLAHEDIVSNEQQVYDLIAHGNKSRHIGETDMNERSSRSHTIFRFVIESTVGASFDKAASVKISYVNLVDLAGSERVSQTNATGIRLREGVQINKSLTTLGLVINQLGSKCDYINFRDSALTKLLKDSLGGNAKTLVIATITAASIDNTQSTLLFAQRAQVIRLCPRVNEVIDKDAMMKQYAEMNNKLRMELEQTQKENATLKESANLTRENEDTVVRLKDQLKSLDFFCKGDERDLLSKRRHTIGGAKLCRQLQTVPLLPKPTKRLSALDESFPPEFDVLLQISSCPESTEKTVQKVDNFNKSDYSKYEEIKPDFNDIYEQLYTLEVALKTESVPLDTPNKKEPTLKKIETFENITELLYDFYLDKLNDVNELNNKLENLLQQTADLKISDTSSQPIEKPNLARKVEDLNIETFENNPTIEKIYHSLKSNLCCDEIAKLNEISKTVEFLVEYYVNNCANRPKQCVTLSPGTDRDEMEFIRLELKCERDENKSLIRQLIAYRNTEIESTKTIKMLQNQVVYLNDVANNWELSFDELSAKREQLEIDLKKTERLRQESANYVKQLNDLKKKIVEREEQISELYLIELKYNKLLNESKTSKLDGNSNSAIFELGIEIKTLKETIEKLEEDKVASEKVSGLLNETKDEIAKLLQDKCNFESKSEKLEAEIAAMREVVSQLEKDKNELTRSQSETYLELEKNIKIENLNCNEEFTAKCTFLSNEVEMLKETICQLKNDKSSMKSKLSKLLAESQENELETNNQIQTLSDDNGKLKLKCEALSNELKLLNEQIAQVEGDKLELTSQLSNLNLEAELKRDTKIVELLREKSDLEAQFAEEIRALEKSICELKAEKASLNEKSLELKNIIEQLKEQSLVLSNPNEKEVTVLKETICQLENDKELLKEELSCMVVKSQDEIKDLNNQILVLFESKTKFTTKCETLRTEVAELKLTVCKVEETNNNLNKELSSVKLEKEEKQTDFARNELEKLTQEGKVLNEQISKLKHDKHILNEENLDLQQSTAKLNEKADKFTKRCETLAQEVTNLKETVQQLENDKSKLKEQLRQMLDEAQEVTEDMNKKVSNLLREVEDLKETNSRLEHDKFGHNNIKVEGDNKILELSNEVVELKSKICKLQEEKCLLNKELEAVKLEAEEKLKKVTTLLHSKNNLESKSEASLQEIVTLKESISQLDKDKSSLDDLLSEKNLKLEQYNEELKQTNTSFLNSKNELITLSSEVALLKSANGVFERDANNLKTELHDLLNKSKLEIDEYKTANGELHEKHSKLVETNRNLTGEIKSIVAEIDLLKNTILQLEHDKSALNEENKKLVQNQNSIPNSKVNETETIEQLQNQLIDLKTEYAKLEAVLEAKEQESDKRASTSRLVLILRDRIEKLQTFNAGYDETIEALKRDLNSYKEKLTQEGKVLNEQISNLKHDKQILNEENLDLQHSTAKLNEKADKFTKRCETLAQEVTNLKETVQQLENDKSKLKEQLRQMLDEAQEVTEDMNKKVSNLLREVEDLKETNSRLEHDKFALNNIKVEGDNKITELSNEVVELKSKICKLQEEKCLLNKKLEAVKLEADEKLKKVTTLLHSKNNLESKSEASLQEIVTLNECISQLEKDKSSLDDLLSEKNLKLEQYNEELKQTNTSFLNSKNELITLSSEVALLKSANGVFERDANNLKTELHDLLNKSKLEIDEYKTANGELHEKHSKLVETNRNLTGEIKSIVAEIDLLKNTILQLEHDKSALNEENKKLIQNQNSIPNSKVNETETIEQLQNQLIDLKTEYAKLEAVLEAKEQESDKRASTSRLVLILRDRIEKLQTFNAGYDEIIKALKRDLNSYKENVKTLEEEKRNLHLEVRASNTKLAELKESIEKQITDSNESVGVKQDQQAAISKMSRDICVLQSKNSAKKREILELKRRLTDMEREAKKSCANCLVLDQEKMLLSKDLNRAQSEVSEIRLQLKMKQETPKQESNCDEALLHYYEKRDENQKAEIERLQNTKCSICDQTVNLTDSQVELRDLRKKYEAVKEICVMRRTKLLEMETEIKKLKTINATNLRF